MKYYCNPVNINYRYQFLMDQRNGGALQINREAADPSLIFFKGRYYIFASMTLGVWVSDDLVNWENHLLPADMPLYDYAPDVRAMGDYLYFSASKREENCDFYRTKDVLNGPYEKIDGTFPFWDPNLFLDDDGRVYFYWGCTNTNPIYGTELDPVTMHPIGETKGLIFGDPHSKGYERIGEDNSQLPATQEEVEAMYQGFLKHQNMTDAQVPAEYKPLIKSMFTRAPYIEGAWMTKHEGKYYLQYAAAGTQYNIYSDGVYVSDSPLGPFILADNNPYSYKPGGFLPGAGHGSTMEDKEGNWWHAATMRISLNHDFERRVGLWPAGFDKDGELFCNQRYGDWPMAVSGEKQDPWRDPAWMLLSYGKAVKASSIAAPSDTASSKNQYYPENVADENVQTFWKPATNSRSEWLKLDLGRPMDVRAIQINFADDKLDIPSPGPIQPGTQARYIDEADRQTQWKLEGSLDGTGWFTIEDKSAAATDLTHDFILREEGLSVRYLRLTDMAVAFNAVPCVSGLRVFGFGQGQTPAVPDYTAERTTDIDMEVEIQKASGDAAVGHDEALGYNILFGTAPEKLYHNYMVFAQADAEKVTQRVGALIRGKSYYVRVDAFNESGIAEGKTIKL